jgi:hypothetical protein
MITRAVVTEKLLAYLNDNITLAELVDWAGLCFVEGGFLPEEDTDMLVDMVMYIAGAHHEYFPLTWDVITEFFRQLGMRVKNVEIEPLPSPVPV